MKKNDRVATVKPHQGAICHGIVMGVSSGKLRVLLDDGVTVLRGGHAAFVPSSLPLPEKLRNPFAKNDRVAWNAGGDFLHGTVIRVSGFTLKVVADGGMSEVSGDFTLFKSSNKPLAAYSAPSPMAAYEVRGYREVAGHDDSTPFIASIYRDGKKVFSASDDGWGGGASYRGATEDVERFHRDAREWAVANGGSDYEFGASDLWVEWYACRRPYGCSAREYLTEPLGSGSVS